MKKRIMCQALWVAALVCPLAQVLGQDDAAVKANPLREAYYGDLHLHTTYSFDAYISGVLTTPDEAYRFARGQEITLHGKAIRRAWPLDFLAVADHAENMGVFDQLADPNSTFAKSELGQLILKDRNKVRAELVEIFTVGKRPPGLSPKTTASTWQRVIATANRHYMPGKFTTFIGYEWTAQPNYDNLHRIVIFRGRTAPVPFTSWDSVRPEDLWTYLESARQSGSDVIAMPHNANASGGLMYSWNDSEGKPIDQVYARRRIRNEPLSEISQEKGQSDTHPVLSPNDEFANFEILDFFADWGLTPKEKRDIHGSYVREAYARGLLVERKVGVNPYKFGVQAGSDRHDGLSDSSEQQSSLMRVKPPEGRSMKERYSEIPDSLYGMGSAGLTGAWAEQNTRESLFDAFRRKETFATTGTRLKFRFFGGWRYPSTLFQDAQWLKKAYAEGVPMGGDLSARPASALAPTFAVWAVKDPNGANLDRAQIIKVWLERERYREKVFDVAWSQGRDPDAKTGQLPPVGNTVDVKTASYKNSIGATQLSAVWKDPEFNSNQAAVYYLRVLEIPTPRWSTILAAQEGTPLPSNRPATIQERGWSSPIWFQSPTGFSSSSR